MIKGHETLVCGENARHYEVISEEMQFGGYSSYEPPDFGRCWGYYLARNKRDARLQAVKDPEFREWVDRARGDHMPPFKGLEVKPFLCIHGNCLGCEDKPCEACDHDAETGWPHELTMAAIDGSHGRVSPDA